MYSFYLIAKNLLISFFHSFNLKALLGNVKKFAYNFNATLDTVINPDEATVKYDYDVLDEFVSKSYDNDEDVHTRYINDINT